jgi:hypothetical protein
LGKDVGTWTLYLLEERSGMSLEDLVDTPDGLILALRQLFGPEGVPIFDCIRSELLLSSVGHPPRNGRVEEFLFALKKAKESAEADAVARPSHETLDAFIEF